jgi:hypothetical protein
MRKTWFLAAALGMALAGRASAAPTFFGPTGLLVMPTADTQALRSWNVHVHGMNHLVTFGGSFGVTKALELGVTAADFSPGDTNALINGKYALLMETAKLPGLAIGGFDIADQLDLKAGFYVVASKSLNSLLGNQASKYNLSAHLGYGVDSIFDNKVFGGLDLQVTQNVQAIAEWVAGDFNFGARLGFGQGIRADLGSYDGEFGGGISYAAALR